MYKLIIYSLYISSVYILVIVCLRIAAIVIDFKEKNCLVMVPTLEMIIPAMLMRTLGPFNNL